MGIFDDRWDCPLEKCQEPKAVKLKPYRSEFPYTCAACGANLLDEDMEKKL